MCPVGGRRDELRSSVQSFDEELTRAEHEQGVHVDRARLQELGVILSFDMETVQ